MSVICAFALAVAAGVAPSTVRACECAPVTPAEAYKQADAVFEGRVLEVSQARGELEGVHRVRLAVVRAWKGVTGETTELLVAPSCGGELVANESYFVYANAQAGKLALGDCSRTRPMAQADDDQRVLGMGVTTFDPKNAAHLPPAASPKREAPARGGCASCSAVGAGPRRAPLALLVALAFGCALSFRRSGSRS